MRLIDADAFKAVGRELCRKFGFDLREVHYSQLDVENNIDGMPTMNAGFNYQDEFKTMFFNDVFEAIQKGELVRVKHGRWFISAKGTTCSECNEAPLTTHRNYCPNCGARMDGGAE